MDRVEKQVPKTFPEGQESEKPQFDMEKVKRFLSNCDSSVNNAINSIICQTFSNL